MSKFPSEATRKKILRNQRPESRAIRKILPPACGVWLLVFGFWILGSLARADLSVASAISMADAIEEISKSYTAATGQKVRHTFAGTNVLARQIEAGAPIDVFISADTTTMDALRKKKLIVQSSVRAVASNELVVVVPNGSSLEFKAASDFLSARRIAMAEPASVPAGIYAKTWLEAEGLWADVKAKTIPLQNVRAALLAAETGNADVAIVYRTDALSSEKVKSAFSVPIEKTGAIEYPAAVLAASARQAEAKRFLESLTGESAAGIFAKHGFGKP